MPIRDYLFVGEDLRIVRGEEARRSLSRQSDAMYVDETLGVVEVPKSRWMIAQQYERRTWMEAGAHADDDRNLNHAREFDRFAVLAGRRFARAIELGCGPFTNLRLISGFCAIDECVLVDPLINDYQAHRNCTYASDRIRTGETRLARTLATSRPGRALRRLIARFAPAAVWEGPRVSMKVASPIEELGDLGKFDLVVMINVLEHCFNAAEIFSKIEQLSRVGTVFVFHDKLYAAAEVRESATHRFDAGHPLRIDSSVILAFLRKRFRPLYEAQTDVVDIVDDIDLSEKGIYFVGEAI